jgi:hypothetical protein
VNPCLAQSWDEWDYRAFIEKRRQHEMQYADFLQRQRAVGQYDYVNVSPMTDSRLLENYIEQTGNLPHRHTHEEFMDVRCWHGL